jgi:hypothetical protein
MREATRAIIVLLLLGSWVLVPGRAEAGDLLLSKALQGESRDGYWVPGKVRMAQHYHARGRGLLIAGTVVASGASILGITAIAMLIHYFTLEAPDSYYDDDTGGMYSYGTEWWLYSAILGPIALVHTVIGVAMLIAGAHNLRKARKVKALAEGRYPMPVLAVSPDGSGGTLGVFFRF